MEWRDEEEENEENDEEEDRGKRDRQFGEVKVGQKVSKRWRMERKQIGGIIKDDDERKEDEGEEEE